MEPFTIMDSNNMIETRCAVVGSGSNGNSVVDFIESKNNSKIELISIDEDIEQIEEKLQGVDIVFITGELSKGRTDVSLIAKMAKDAGALTIGIIDSPIEYEEDNLQELKKELDSLIIIPKELNVIDIIDGILGVIFTSGENDISLDFMDLTTVMSNQGIVRVGIGESNGKKAAFEAMNKALVMANAPIKNASGILVHFAIHPEFHFIQLCDAMDVIHKSVEESADVISGTTTDENLPLDFIRVILVATGFEKKRLVPANNVL